MCSRLLSKAGTEPKWGSSALIPSSVLFYFLMPREGPGTRKDLEVLSARGPPGHYGGNTPNYRESRQGGCS